MAYLCENCHQETEKLPFCPHCGLAQTCPTCERPFDKGAKFCGQCGEKRLGPKELSPTKGKSPSEQSEEVAPSLEQQPNKRRIPPVAFGIVIAALIFIAIMSSNLFTSTEKQIEKVITQYIQAVENADYQAVKSLYHPDSPFVEDASDFLDIPSDLEVVIHEFFDFEIEEDYAEVKVTVSIKSFILNESASDDMYVELVKHDNKWYLYDVY